jgi:short-subunit dehydrogenase
VLVVSPGATRTEFFDVVGTAEAAVGRYQTTEQVVTRALHELDRTNTPPSFVSGRLNAMMSKASGIMPRRITLRTAGRVLR